MLINIYVYILLTIFKELYMILYYHFFKTRILILTLTVFNS